MSFLVLDNMHCQHTSIMQNNTQSLHIFEFAYRIYFNGSQHHRLLLLLLYFMPHIVSHFFLSLYFLYYFHNRITNFDDEYMYLKRLPLSPKRKMLRKQSQLHKRLRQQRLWILLLMLLLQKLIMLLTFSTCYPWTLQMIMTQKQHLVTIMIGQVFNVCHLLLFGNLFMHLLLLHASCQSPSNDIMELNTQQLLMEHQQLTKLLNQNLLRPIANPLQ